MASNDIFGGVGMGFLTLSCGGEMEHTSVGGFYGVDYNTGQGAVYRISMAGILSRTSIVSPALRGKIDDLNRLTERETEVLQLAGSGLSTKGIALDLGISSGTVKWHLRSIYQKLCAASREDALRKARKRALIR